MRLDMQIANNMYNLSSLKAAFKCKRTLHRLYK